MGTHYVGQNQNSGGTSSTRGSSLAVRQFVDLISGWMPVHSPSTPFRVEAVVVEERYCLRCYGVRRFDVVIGKPNEFGTTLEAAFCRCCGAEV